MIVKNLIWRLPGMKQMDRSGMAEWQKSEIWRRWRKGESLSGIGRAIGIPGI